MNLIDNDDVNYFVNSKDLNDKNYKEKKKYNHGNKAFEEMLIDFQNFLKDKKLIEGDDDSFKQIARQFIKCRKVMYKKTLNIKLLL